MTADEILEIWDWETGRPTGRPVPRRVSHREGIPHEGIHMWIIRSGKNGPEFLFQNRAMHKESYPGVLDITVGGHVPFGLESSKIQKEAVEEIGILPDEENLVDLGYTRYEEISESVFHREIQHVYLLRDDRPLDKYRFNDGEVDGIYAVSMDSLERLMAADFSFDAEGYDGKRLFIKNVSRSDFHPQLFADSMKEYMAALITASRELYERGTTGTRMKL
ncbi:MAG: NUDIX domain-containing protein [Spirochaetes bacterium]|jgi:isopentenyldiphosphate isomerase|nr:NUDIX domain-containing protein [Spirochaetota bacterium]